MSVAVAPRSIAELTKLRVRLGAPMPTVTDFAMAPPGPVQSRLNVVGARIEGSVAVPDAARVPLQPPLATQLSAFTDDQLKTTGAPSATWDCSELSTRAGAPIYTVAVAVTEFVPSVQVSVN